MAILMQLLAVLAASAVVAWVGRALCTTQRAGYWALVVLLPLMGLALYHIVGTPAALQPGATEPVAMADDVDPGANPQAFAQAVTDLEARLKADPNQPEGWVLLARARAAQGNAAAARDALARAVQLAPEDPALLVDAAQAQAQTAPDNRFSDEAVAMLRKAVRLQPEHQRARWFIGVAQRQRGQNAEAARTWEALLPQVDAATAASLRTQIAAARAAAGLPPMPAQAATQRPAPAGRGPATAGNTIAITLKVDPSLVQRMPDATVFVLARIPGGPPMPVAVERHLLRALPASITLDDGDSPMPTQALSSLQQVEVLARISASGTAMRQEGDIESVPVRVALPVGKPITLRLGAE